jgi:hypothetical protein
MDRQYIIDDDWTLHALDDSGLQRYLSVVGENEMHAGKHWDEISWPKVYLYQGHGYTVPTAIKLITSSTRLYIFRVVAQLERGLEEILVAFEVLND